MKLPRLTFATAALAVAIFLLPGAGESLAWDLRDTGRISLVTALTAHLTHWDLPHLLFDLLAWTTLGSLVETHSRRLWLWTIGLSVPAVSLFVPLAAPDILIYRGLSGLDSALLIVAALMIHDRACRQDDPGMRWVAVGCILALLMKIAWEWSTGSPVFARGGDFIAVPQAHLAGTMAGFAAAMVQKIRFRSAPGSTHSSKGLPTGACRKEVPVVEDLQPDSDVVGTAKNFPCNPAGRFAIRNGFPPFKRSEISSLDP